jgi:ribosomal protein S18 acetylase RimI-like enzyme
MESETSIRLVGDTETQDAIRKAMSERLNQFDLRFAPAATFEPLVMTAVTSDGTVIGGLVGQLCPDWHWGRVAMLWVDETYRVRGIGRQLLRAAELEAVRRGCQYVQLETFSFGARGFYEKQGYSVFGVQEHFPPGHRRFYLSKTLSADPPTVLGPPTMTKDAAP